MTNHGGEDGPNGRVGMTIGNDARGILLLAAVAALAGCGDDAAADGAEGGQCRIGAEACEDGLVCSQGTCVDADSVADYTDIDDVVADFQFGRKIITPDGEDATPFLFTLTGVDGAPIIGDVLLRVDPEGAGEIRPDRLTLGEDGSGQGTLVGCDGASVECPSQVRVEVALADRPYTPVARSQWVRHAGVDPGTPIGGGSGDGTGTGDGNGTGDGTGSGDGTGGGGLTGTIADFTEIDLPPEVAAECPINGGALVVKQSGVEIFRGGHDNAMTIIPAWGGRVIQSSYPGSGEWDWARIQILAGGAGHSRVEPGCGNAVARSRSDSVPSDNGLHALVRETDRDPNDPPESYFCSWPSAATEDGESFDAAGVIHWEVLCDDKGPAGGIVIYQLECGPLSVTGCMTWRADR